MNNKQKITKNYQDVMQDLQADIYAASLIFEDNIIALAIDTSKITEKQDFKKYPITPTYFFHNKPHSIYVPDSQKSSARGLKR